jgi:hypothetical protein
MTAMLSDGQDADFQKGGLRVLPGGIAALLTFRFKHSCRRPAVSAKFFILQPITILPLFAHSPYFSRRLPPLFLRITLTLRSFAPHFSSVAVRLFYGASPTAECCPRESGLLPIA